MGWNVSGYNMARLRRAALCRGRGLFLDVVPVRAKFFVTLLQALLGRKLFQCVEVADEHFLESRSRRRQIIMGSAERFGDNLVGQPELEEIFRRDLQRFGSFRARGAVFPQNRGAT